MIGGVVEVADDGRHLSVYRGFLKVDENKEELGRVPLDDICALILSARQATLSRALMAELAERKAIIVTCGKNYHPISLTWPFDAHHETAGILHDQIAASKPLRKRLWQEIVVAKIENQRAALDSIYPGHKKLKDMAALIRQVKSGDPENREAQAARLYWPALMGPEFRRDREGASPNNFLNYGYAILRAAAARAVCAAGLHPALGLHHRSRVNSFALVDDLMEPFRPVVDIAALKLQGDGQDSLDPDSKRQIAATLQQDMLSEKGASPIINCLQRVAQSLVTSLQSGRANLNIPVIKPVGSLL